MIHLSDLTADDREARAAERKLRWRDVPEKARPAIANGCGGKGGWLRPPQLRFRASCDQHDFYYWRGSVEEDREVADLQFLQAMRADANLLPWWRRPAHRLLAWIYYRAVRRFGSRFFHYGRRRRGLEDLEPVREGGPHGSGDR